MQLGKTFATTRLVLTTLDGGDTSRPHLVGKSVLEVYRRDSLVRTHMVLLTPKRFDKFGSFELRMDPTMKDGVYDGGAWWIIPVAADSVAILQHFILDILIGAVMHWDVWHEEQRLKDKLKCLDKLNSEIDDQLLAKVRKNMQLCGILKDRATTIEHLEHELETLREEHEALLKRTGELVTVSMRSQEQLQLIADVAAGEFEIHVGEVQIGKGDAKPSKGQPGWQSSPDQTGQAAQQQQYVHVDAKLWEQIKAALDKPEPLAAVPAATLVAGQTEDNRDRPWMLPEHRQEVAARIRLMNAQAEMEEARAAELRRKLQPGQGATHEAAATAAADDQKRERERSAKQRREENETANSSGACSAGSCTAANESAGDGNAVKLDAGGLQLP